jgi:TMEM175 potassium channel family protein
VSTGRLEAFSDGVIAVAATLLVLNITLPALTTGETLIHGLLVQWPKYAAYVVSFTTIGIIWINHHAAISRLRQADRTILILNLVLLMTIAVLPFATSLLANYLKQGGHYANLAAGVYSGSFLVMSLAFAALNHHILMRKAHLLGVELSDERRRQILVRSVAGIAPYAGATGLAVVSPYVTLIICGAIGVFYASPLGSGG